MDPWRKAPITAAKKAQFKKEMSDDRQALCDLAADVSVPLPPAPRRLLSQAAAQEQGWNHYVVQLFPAFTSTTFGSGNNDEQNNNDSNKGSSPIGSEFASAISWEPAVYRLPDGQFKWHLVSTLLDNSAAQDAVLHVDKASYREPEAAQQQALIFLNALKRQAPKQWMTVGINSWARAVEKSVAEWDNVINNNNNDNDNDNDDESDRSDESDSSKDNNNKSNKSERKLMKQRMEPVSEHIVRVDITQWGSHLYLVVGFLCETVAAHARQDDRLEKCTQCLTSKLATQRVSLLVEPRWVARGWIPFSVRRPFCYVVYRLKADISFADFQRLAQAAAACV